LPHSRAFVEFYFIQSEKVVVVGETPNQLSRNCGGEVHGNGSSGKSRKGAKTYLRKRYSERSKKGEPRSVSVVYPADIDFGGEMWMKAQQEVNRAFTKEETAFWNEERETSEPKVRVLLEKKETFRRKEESHPKEVSLRSREGERLGGILYREKHVFSKQE